MFCYNTNNGYSMFSAAKLQIICHTKENLIHFFKFIA